MPVRFSFAVVASTMVFGCTTMPLLHTPDSINGAISAGDAGGALPSTSPSAPSPASSIDSNQPHRITFDPPTPCLESNLSVSGEGYVEGPIDLLISRRPEMRAPKVFPQVELGHVDVGVDGKFKFSFKIEKYISSPTTGDIIDIDPNNQYIIIVRYGSRQDTETFSICR